MDILTGISFCANILGLGILALALTSIPNALRLAAWLISWALHLQECARSLAAHRQRHPHLRAAIAREVANF